MSFQFPQVDTVVSQLAQQYAQSESTLKGGLLMPTVQLPVSEDGSGYLKATYIQFDAGEFFGDADSTDYEKHRAAPGSGAILMDTPDLAAASFTLDQRRGKMPVPGSMSRIGPVDVRASKVASAITRFNLQTERQIASKVDAAANYATGLKATLASGSRWNEAGGDPQTLIAEAKNAVAKQSGRRPNVMWMGTDVAAALLANEGGHMIGGGAVLQGLLDESDLAKSFQVSKILVMDSVYNNANRGQTATNAFVWTSTSCGLLYVPENALEAASSGQALPAMQANFAAFGYTFVPQGKGSGPNSMEVIRKWDDDTASWLHYLSDWRTPVTCSTLLGYHWTTAVD
jgi:hypothetical protein|tara:strand:+ start:16391 stop:17419 length:1029 start_codon:yes stop_codon:yes gene_type:complete